MFEGRMVDEEVWHGEVASVLGAVWVANPSASTLRNTFLTVQHVPDDQYINQGSC
jgi:hypothetical protein